MAAAPAERQVRARLDALMQATGLEVDLDALVADLPVGERQRLEILKALYRGAQILILDEPTAVLTPQETEQLFGVLRALRDAGHHHPADHAQAQGGHGAVRRGHGDARRARGAETARSPTPRSTAWPRPWSAARCTWAATRRTPPRRARCCCEATDLRVRDALGVARLDDVDLTLRAGEIVGVAGVSGNGQSELLDVLSGLLPPDRRRAARGRRSASTPAHWLDPPPARALGLAHVPEDRQRARW